MGRVLMLVWVFTRLGLLGLLLLAKLLVGRVMLMMLNRTSGVNIHLLRVTGKRRDRSRMQDGTWTESTAGQKRGCQVLDRGTVGAAKLVDYVLPRHVVMSGVACDSTAATIVTSAKLPDQSSPFSGLLG
jgi:hypothetical protein